MPTTNLVYMKKELEKLTDKEEENVDLAMGVRTLCGERITGSLLRTKTSC